MDKQLITDIPSDPLARWGWIKFQLTAQGKTISSVARDTGVTAQTISRCQHQPYPKSEQALASAIGYEAHEIFPDRYHKDGSRKRLYSRKTH